MKKNRIFAHLGIKILAFFLALITWIIVVNIDDYSISKTITGIVVQQLNGDVITELDKIYDVTKGDTVDIIIKGKRSIVENLTADDFIATADLSQMSITNAVRIDIKPTDNEYEAELTITPIDNMLTLSLENKIEKQMVVSISEVGDEAEGYQIGEKSLDATVVTVSGAESVISKITEVRVEVNLDNLNDNLEVLVKPICYDAYGEVVSEGKYTISNKEISVSAPIYKVKEVPIKVTLQGSTTSDYKVVEATAQPNKIKIAAPDELIRSYNQINIDDISVSGKTSSIQETINISDYLDKGIILADVNESIVVNVIIEKKSTKELNVDIENMILENTMPGYKYQIILSEDFSVKLSGLSDEIKKLAISDFNFRIDCQGVYVGNNQVKLLWDESDVYDIEVFGEITVIVTQ